MERFLQYLDDIDDLAGVLGLLRERFRHLLFKVFRAVLGLFVMVGAFWLATTHPVMALAICAALVVVLVVVLGLRLLGPGSHRSLNSH